jgi:tight adherence protein C
VSPLVLVAIVFGGTLATAGLGIVALRSRRAAGRVGAVSDAGASAFAPVAPPSPFTETLGRLARPTDPVEVSLQRNELVQAGFRGPRNLEVYLAVRGLLAVLLPLVVLIFVPELRLLFEVLVGLIVATIGYYAPWFAVRTLRVGRQREARDVLPNALDMLVSCLESGLGLDAAFQYLARQLRPISPSFSAELAMVNAELRAGIRRIDALKAMEVRVGIEELAALVNLFAQAERYGSSIAQSLRAHAQLTRRRRLLDAERRAAEAAPQLTVAMILLVLPPLFIVLLGPAMVTVITQVVPSLESP